MSDSDNTPYALPTGQIRLNEIHVEAGGTSGTQCSMNDVDIRGIIGKASGTQSRMGEWHGAKAPAAFRNASTGSIQGLSTGGVFSYSLASLGAQEGDLVVVATCQDGPGSMTPYNMSGWTALVPNGPNVSFTQDIYCKVMGSSPEQNFNLTMGPYYFEMPVVAVCITNVGALQTHQWSGMSGTLSVNPPSRTVSNAGSVGIVVLCRDDNAAGTTTSSGPSGYTKAGNKYTSNAGIGYNWEQSVDVFYKLNLPAGTHDPSAISWNQGYDNATATTAIFY